MGIECEITGREGQRHKDLGDMIQAEGQRMSDSHLQSVESAIQSTRCPVHGRRATATRRTTPSGHGFDISGSCDSLVPEAQAAAASVR